MVKTSKPKIITEEIDDDSVNTKSDSSEAKTEKESEIKPNEVVDKPVEPEDLPISAYEKKPIDQVEEVVKPSVAETAKISSFRDLDISQKPVVNSPSESSDTTKTEETSSSESKQEETVLSNKNEDVIPSTTETDQTDSADIKKWLSDVRPDTTKEMEKTGKPYLKIFLIVLVILFIGSISIGGFYYYKNNINKSGSEDSGVSIEGDKSPTVIPTATPQAEKKLTEYKIDIKNGSGTAGEASKVSALLVKSGFSEANTGNADNYNYQTTIISLKENLPIKVYETIKESIGKTYIIEKSEKAVESSSVYDIVIIVGKKKAS